MNPFKGRHFQRDIILWAVRWYCKYGISYRELQEMLAERGVNVDHSTIYRWVQRYAPEMEKRLRWYWRNRGQFGYRKLLYVKLIFYHFWFFWKRNILDVKTVMRGH